MLTPEAYSQIPRRAMDMSDYIDVARRNKGWIFGPIFAGLVIGAIVALVLPNTYVSQASLRIAPAQISASILPYDLSQQMSDRINQMQQDILSRASLSELIQRPELNLYKKEREHKPLDDIIERMRSKDVKIQVVKLAGQGDRAASAFTVSFAYPDRYKAQAVVSALVTRFMDSNLSGQRAAGEVTQGFVHDEVAHAKTELDNLNDQLTAFRKQNLGRLPEQLQMNVQAMSSLQAQRVSLDEALNRDSQEKIILDGKLDTLRSQKDTYGSLAQDNFDDPAQTGKSERVRELNRAISETEVQLAAKKQIYTDTHPDVLSLQATLESLKKQRDQAAQEDDKQASAAQPKSGASRRASAYVTAQLNDMQLMQDQTRQQLKALEVGRATKMKELDQVNKQIAQFQSRLESGPANEQRYVQLMSDQQQANQKYQDLLKKQNLSEANQDAQTRKAGENLEVLDSASLPESPTAPNRWMIIGIGFGAGTIIGIAFAAVREIKDTSLKNLKDVRAYTQLPILSSIPLLENDLAVQQRRRIAYLSWSTAVLVGMLAISASLYYHFFILKS